MILKALYDYYHRCGDLPAFGLEEKQIGFILILDNQGRFLRFEDMRSPDKKSAASFLVRKSVGRSSAPVANYLYDNSSYVFGFSDKDAAEKSLKYYNTFKEKILELKTIAPENPTLGALNAFYQLSPSEHLTKMQQDPLWEEIVKNLGKKFSFFSFRIEGDTEIAAQKRELLDLANREPSEDGVQEVCLITGQKSIPVLTTTNTMIPGSQATAKLVAFQVKSGYDSYGKTQGENAPISAEAEFAYTTAINTMLASGSHNKFQVGSRTYLFWASSDSEVSHTAEEGVFSMFGYNEEQDDPNAKIDKVREVFNAIRDGIIRTDLDDKFYILGLAPNAARIAVVYWSEIKLKDFAVRILKHFDDMQIVDGRKEKKPYYGLREILSAVTLGGKVADATPNLPEAVVKSIFEGIPYPYTLFAGCIRRIRAEQSLTISRVAILKAYLNRINDNNNQKLNIMLDKENTNQGYLCGRLFAVLEKIQEDANHINSIKERYMNAASATPATVFATVLNLSQHHQEKLTAAGKIYYEKIKQEIFGKLSSNGFPTHLDLQDQGRFFVGYYHQRQDLFTSKKEDNQEY